MNFVEEQQEKARERTSKEWDYVVPSTFKMIDTLISDTIKATAQKMVLDLKVIADYLRVKEAMQDKDAFVMAQMASSLIENWNKLANDLIAQTKGGEDARG